MTPIYFVEDTHIEDLYPLTYWRPAGLLRCGECTLLERAQRMLPRSAKGVLVSRSFAGKEILPEHLALNPQVDRAHGAIFINSRWLMTEKFHDPPQDWVGQAGDSFAWMHVSPQKLKGVDLRDPSALEKLMGKLRTKAVDALMIRHPWDLIRSQRAMLEADFTSRGPAMQSELPPGAHALSPERTHIAKKVKIYPGVVLDASEGPITIDRGAVIRANSVITGPVYIGCDCTVRTGADIREETSLGPNCRVGGEVIGSIFLANSNKQHEGFMGQSIVGEWVNIGAGTITSNLKNTYGEVRMPIHGTEVDTGMNFLGSIIADHVKIGIGVCLSTGTVIGFASHVLDPRPSKFIPSFAWATADGIERLDFYKATTIAKAAMARRKEEFGPADEEAFTRIYKACGKREKYKWPR
jgi:UDP-N-acetylglucosamine diphosphorylase / glucose-1-phosphate thymidylyltransferase / UDP-N-acetylgalactosamine diphosphorylase / glucosamine-1-phosphate N-acetyltransferase / galactosamine-1-phosphate N-acetyltransferase